LAFETISTVSSANLVAYQGISIVQIGATPVVTHLLDLAGVDVGK
jgi:hypothetical protein